MNEQEMTILNRLAGFGVYEVKAVNGVRRDEWQGTEVLVSIAGDEEERDFYFPEYAGMNDVEMAEVIANNLREELWNSLRP